MLELVRPEEADDIQLEDSSAFDTSIIVIVVISVVLAVALIVGFILWVCFFYYY